MMPKRPFLARYSAESVEELLAMESTHRIDSLVLAFEEAIDQKAGRDGVESLTPEELTVLAIEGLEREVNNGGYYQFFVNSSVQYAPDIVAALRRIECPKVAAITEAAIAALRLPHLSVGEIARVLCDDDESRGEALAACDRQFFEYPEPIADRLFDFIKANRSQIRL